MKGNETREQIKKVKSRTFDSETPAFNPTLFPSQKIDKALYEDIISRSSEFGIGSVLAEKLSTYEEGATLLDHFAGIAMDRQLKMQKKMFVSSEEFQEEIAESSFRMAEQMLKARKRALARLKSLGASD